MRKTVAAALAGLLLSATATLSQAPANPVAAPQAAPAVDAANTLVIELKTGKVLIQLRPDLAPKHVERIKMLAKEGFYNNVKWHRVINGFMAQTGDPKGIGVGGSKYPDLPAEFTPEPYRRGTLGAARTGNPNSANSQFFICFNDMGCRSLTGQYTVFGQVIEGMDHVDQITRGEPPSTPDVMLKVYLQSDQKKS
jgi:peptidylprolyl isomerase